MRTCKILLYSILLFSVQFAFSQGLTLQWKTSSTENAIDMTSRYIVGDYGRRECCHHKRHDGC